VRERQPDIRPLGSDEGRTRRCRTAKGEQVITSRGVGCLAERVLEELLTAEEILGRTAIAERNLLDEGVTPSTRDGEVRARRPRGADSRKFKDEDDVLNAVVGRDGEDGRPTREVGELLDVASVLDGAEALLTRSFRVGVVAKLTLPFGIFQGRPLPDGSRLYLLRSLGSLHPSRTLLVVVETQTIPSHNGSRSGLRIIQCSPFLPLGRDITPVPHDTFR